MEPGSGKHSVYTHFPMDPDCDICLRTHELETLQAKIVSTFSATANTVFQDDSMGMTLPIRNMLTSSLNALEEWDAHLITADHKVLSEESESRNNHRYAVLVQYLATQSLQSYTCKTKTSQETQKSSQKFLEPTRKPKVIYTDNSLEFGKSCEELS